MKCLLSHRTVPVTRMEVRIMPGSALMTVWLMVAIYSNIYDLTSIFY